MTTLGITVGCARCHDHNNVPVHRTAFRKGVQRLEQRDYGRYGDRRSEEVEAKHRYSKQQLHPGQLEDDAQADSQPRPTL
jgi:hypothetical protein